MGATLVTNAGKKLALNRTWKATPDYTAPTVFKIGTDSTAPAVTDTDLGTAVNINGSDTKVFVTSYPVLDETNHQVTIRCIANSTEANGDTLVEFGLANTDGTELLYSHSTHTAVSKTSSIEVVYVQKDKLV